MRRLALPPAALALLACAPGLPAPVQPLSATPPGALGPMPELAPLRPLEEPVLERVQLDNGMTVVASALPGRDLVVAEWACRTDLGPDSWIDAAVAQGAIEPSLQRAQRDAPALPHFAVGSAPGELRVSLAARRDQLESGLSALATTLAGADAVDVSVWRERTRVERLARTRDTAMGVDAAMARLFGREYIDKTLGTPRALAALDAAAVERRFEQVVDPARCGLFVAGDVDAAAVADVARASFGSLRGRRADAARAPPPRASEAAAGDLFAIQRRPLGGVHLITAHEAPPATSGDALAFRLLTSVLARGGASRLFRELRWTSALSYGPRADYLAHDGWGVLITQAVVEERRFARSLEIVLGAFAGIAKTTPSEDELRAAKAVYREELRGQLASPAGLADRLATDFLQGLAPGETARRARDLDRITTSDLQRLARRYLAARRTRVVAIGDYSYIAAPLMFDEREVDYGDVDDIYAQ